MNPDFVSILVCPETGQSLRLEIKEAGDNGMVKTGELVTEDGTRRYEIVRGVPRFVPKENYVSSFGYEWNKWPRTQFESENRGGYFEGWTTNMFMAITELTPELVQGKLVYDVGCGPGRFIDVIRTWGGRAVGLDMSLAVEAAHENFKDDKEVLIVQGDALNPPFRKDTFDYSYSIGVLHHTPNPEKGLAESVARTRPNGRFACNVYSVRGTYHFSSVAFFRFLTKSARKLLGPRTSSRLAVAYSVFSAKRLYPWVMKLKQRHRKLFDILTKRLLVIMVDLPDERWRILDTFDAITPHFASTHTPEQMVGWFERAGCADIQHTNWGDTSYRGTKKADGPCAE